MRPAARYGDFFLVSTYIGLNGNRLRVEAVIWVADCFNRSATKANTGWQSPYEVFFTSPQGTWGAKRTE